MEGFCYIYGLGVLDRVGEAVAARQDALVMRYLEKVN